MRPLATYSPGMAKGVADAGRAVARGVVLPRFLRRPARALRRFEWRVPHHFGLKALIAFALATGVTGTLAGGHLVTIVSAVSAWSGLAIDEVKITGQSQTSEVDVLHKLEIGQYPSLLTFDVDAARARIEQLPWVEHATLKKLFPNTLEVSIAERTPFAIWQHGGKVSLIDESGKVIADAVGDRYAKLPFVVGPGAAARAKEFADLIATAPDLTGKVRAGVLISGRRWNVVLDNGIELLLPSENAEAALATVAKLDAEKSLLSRQIAAVDLRLPGQLILRLTEQGLADRKAMLDERDKLAQRRRTNT